MILVSNKHIGWYAIKQTLPYVIRVPIGTYIYKSYKTCCGLAITMEFISKWSKLIYKITTVDSTMFMNTETISFTEW